MADPRSPESRPQAYAHFLERLGRGSPSALEPIPGGASPRRFFRVRFREGEPAILMDVPEETPDVRFASERGRGWPFLEVRALLEERGVRVPRLLSDAHEDGLLLVEDLGETLEQELAKHEERRGELYRRAVEELAVAQARLEPLPLDSVIRERAFDHELLRFEVEHFREWGLEARGFALDDDARAAFDSASNALVDRIARLPRGFTHRDYQSRNLLVGASGTGHLGWVDFQDAMLGPRAYDLVALLCDSYQPFDRSFVEQRLDDYAAARGLDADARRELGHEFDLIAVQRKLKDAGRFVFIERVRGDASFLPFIAPTLAIVEDALSRLAHDPMVEALTAVVKRAAALR
jgi:aminoglycoside/choline kinase family phosphotransferase